MFRFFLFMVSVMAASISMAEDISPCPGDTISIQIMTPGYGGDEAKDSAAKIPKGLPHFRAFVTAVTERVSAHLAKEKLCITGAKSMESMKSAGWDNHSLLQFMHWPLFMGYEYLVPVVTSSSSSGCWISSPWIDLVVDRETVPSIRGIVYWNERQLLADQAMLAGVRNVPLGTAMPLKPSELGHFMGEYQRYQRSETHLKPIEERVSPEILWLLRSRSSTAGQTGMVPFIVTVRGSMHKAIGKGAEGYTQLVLALIDRCFASDRAILDYNSINDVTDPVLLEQYKIDKLFD